MINKKRVIIAFVIVFLIGMFTGGAVFPAIVHTFAGNPYSHEEIGKRLLNSQFIDKKRLTAEERANLISLEERYFDKYAFIRDDFKKARMHMNEEFIMELSKIIPADVFNKYKEKSDSHMKKRTEAHEKWRYNANKSDKSR